MRIDVGDMFSNDSADYDKLDFYGNPIPDHTDFIINVFIFIIEGIIILI